MRVFVLFILFMGAVIFFGCGPDRTTPMMSDMGADMIDPSPPREPPEDMVRIPAGSFQMGSNDPEAFANEKPVKSDVDVGEFYIDAREVTNAEYREFVQANSEWQKGDTAAGRLADANYLKHWNGNDYPDEKADHPVVYVSWHAAKAYAEWRGERLPTEAQWEYAARGGLPGQKYPWGNSINTSNANYSLNIGNTVPVDRYPANGYGLHNMAGNVWEWCDDQYEGETGSRVLRGGSWLDSARFLRVSTRGWSTQKFTSNYIGFRCVFVVQ